MIDLLIYGVGNDDKFPKLPNGERDLFLQRSHIETWKDMEDVFASGKAKAIGVANYSVPFLKDLLKTAKVIPAVNQIENHPLLPQREIIEFCGWRGIHITAYSPLGSAGSPLLQLPAIQEIAQKRNATPASVLLSWHSELIPFRQSYVYSMNSADY